MHGVAEYLEDYLLATAQPLRVASAFEAVHVDVFFHCPPSGSSSSSSSSGSGGGAGNVIFWQEITGDGDAYNYHHSAGPHDNSEGSPGPDTYSHPHSADVGVHALEATVLFDVSAISDSILDSTCVFFLVFVSLVNIL